MQILLDKITGTLNVAVERLELDWFVGQLKYDNE
jgi:hypothetical protein